MSVSQQSMDLEITLHRGATEDTERGCRARPTLPYPIPQAHASSMTTTSNRGLPSSSESRSPPATASVHATTCAAWTAATRCARCARCSPSLPARTCDQAAHGVSRISGDRRHPETARCIWPACTRPAPYPAWMPGWLDGSNSIAHALHACPCSQPPDEPCADRC